MDGRPIKKEETLYVLGFHFDRCLTWSAMIDTNGLTQQTEFGMSSQDLELLGLQHLTTCLQGFY